MDTPSEEGRNRDEALSHPAGLRFVPEVLASLQCARRARRNFSDGARRNDWASAQTGNASRARVARSANSNGSFRRSCRMKSARNPARAARSSSPSTSTTTSADFLFEIGCEEIPAGMIAKAARELKAILGMHLSTHALVGETTVEESIETFGAPRRLVAIARNIRVKQEDVIAKLSGHRSPLRSMWQASRRALRTASRKNRMSRFRDLWSSILRRANALR